MLHTVTEEMIRYFAADIRRINHALKVHSFARLIGALEGIPARELAVLELSAVLHDIGIHEAERKHGSTAGSFQELEGPPIARDILERCGADVDDIERVIFLVGHHHSYAAIDGIDFQILVEADFIVNIDEDAMNMASIESIVRKYFKTASGVRLIKAMHPDVTL